MVMLACWVFPICFLLLLPLSWLESGGSWKGVLPATVCAFLVAYGWFAFMAQAGGLRFAAESFEWPVVSTAGAVENARGQRFLPVIAPGRIQVYDRDGEFMRGWFLPAGGGGFKLHVTSDDDLEVFTVRGNRRLVYAEDGTMLNEGEYRDDYDRLPVGPAGHVDRTSTWYLWPLAQPYLALLPFAAGLAGIGVLFNHPRLRGVDRLSVNSGIQSNDASLLPTVTPDGTGGFSIDVGMMPTSSDARD